MIKIIIKNIIWFCLFSFVAGLNWVDHRIYSICAIAGALLFVMFLIQEIRLWNKIKAKLGDGTGVYIVRVDKYKLFNILNIGIPFESISHNILSKEEIDARSNGNSEQQ